MVWRKLKLEKWGGAQEGGGEMTTALREGLSKEVVFEQKPDKTRG